MLVHYWVTALGDSGARGELRHHHVGTGRGDCVGVERVSCTEAVRNGLGKRGGGAGYPTRCSHCYRLGSAVGAACEGEGRWGAGYCTRTGRRHHHVRTRSH